MERMIAMKFIFWVVVFLTVDCRLMIFCSADALFIASWRLAGDVLEARFWGDNHPKIGALVPTRKINIERKRRSWAAEKIWGGDYFRCSSYFRTGLTTLICKFESEWLFRQKFWVLPAEPRSDADFPKSPNFRKCPNHPIFRKSRFSENSPVYPISPIRNRYPDLNFGVFIRIKDR